MQAHSLLSAVAKAQGDLAAALRHHEAFHAGYERCFNEESARKARLLAVRHEVDLARGEAQRQRLENARLTEALAAIGARLQSVDKSAARGSGSQPARPEDLQALGLTPREAEVLFWVTQGKTNDDVTVILGTSMSAVKKHLGRIYEKLGVENRTAAANAARRAAPGAATR
jgi:DNA-binding CsgD family transcriptional regulator